MTGEAHFLDALLVVGGGVAIVLFVRLATRSLERKLLLRERMHFVCPVTGLPVGATLTEDLRADRLTDVNRCSGWRHFWQPCDKRCLAPLNDGSLHEAPPVKLRT